MTSHGEQIYICNLSNLTTITDSKTTSFLNLAFYISLWIYILYKTTTTIIDLTIANIGKNINYEITENAFTDYSTINIAIDYTSNKMNYHVLRKICYNILRKEVTNRSSIIEDKWCLHFYLNTFSSSCCWLCCPCRISTLTCVKTIFFFQDHSPDLQFQHNSKHFQGHFSHCIRDATFLMPDWCVQFKVGKLRYVSYLRFTVRYFRREKAFFFLLSAAWKR